MDRVGHRIVLAAAAALALVVAGCGGSSGGGGGSDFGNVRPTASETLRISGFGPGDEVAQARIALAKKALAPAKVRNPEGGFNDQQFLASVAAGNAPDLVYMDRQKVGTYAAKGALTPLSDCIDGQSIDMGQYRPAAVGEVTYRGETYGIPEFFTTRTVIVDDSLAQQAGGADAFDTSDWSRLKQAATKVAQVSGGKVRRIGFDPKLPEFFPLWAKANGVDLLGKDGLHANLDDPKAIEALDYAVGLIRAQGGWGAFKAFRDTWDFFGAENEFAANQVGAFPMEEWYFNVLAQNSPQAKLSVLPFRSRGGDTINYSTGSAWAIPAQAKHPGLACLWAKTITSVDAWLAAAKARLAVAKQKGYPFTGIYTANKTADEKIINDLYTPSGTQYDRIVQTVLKAQDASFALPASPAGAEVTTAWQNAVNRVLAGQQSAAAALKQAQSEAQRALDAASR